jgi:hypothetical protein
MLRNSLIAAVASTAIAVATPAFAQAHGGGGGSGGPPGAGGSPAGSVSQGPTNASPTGISHANENSVLSSPTGSTMQTTTAPMTGTANGNSQATVNSQGPANASPTGIAHANSNSVLARGAVASSTLPGLTTGLVVNNSSGTQVGTVSRVITGPNDTIRAVVVTDSSGKTYTLAPSSLSISGSVVTTTSTSIGG